MIPFHLRTSICLMLLVLFIIPICTAQIAYEISFPNAVHQEAEIKLQIDGVPEGPVAFRMSRTSPGRYSLHEFAKNVYNVHATDLDGRPLSITRPNPHQWDVHNHKGNVILYYTLYADRADGTYSQIDTTHGHLNMPATFMFARDHSDWPIEITFNPPEGSNWKIATQLFPSDNPQRFTAPNLHYFMDSPTELSDHSVRTWTIPRGPGSEDTYQIRLAVHHTGTEPEVDAYAEMVKKVVEEQVKIFGEPPVFETGTYTFIADYLPWASGDGMEHRNSTILTSSSSLATNANGLLGTVSHEFFHAWNVERIRPAALEPFNYEAANMAGEMWFAEGFTSYYTPLAIRRAKLMDDDTYANALQRSLNTVINSPGRRYFSPIEMSMRAPFVDRATANDPLNLSNTFISYYTWGAMIGLNLDLHLRQRGFSLDEFFRFLWDRFGKAEVPYSVNGLEQALAVYVGNPAFARFFFDSFIRDSQVPDYAALLDQAGFTLQLKNPDVPTLGNPNLRFTDEGAVVQTNTLIDTPLYRVGIDRGDTITHINNTTITSSDSITKMLASHKPGDTLSIRYIQRGEHKSAALQLTQDPELEALPYEALGKALSSEQKAFRSSWLDGN